LSVEKAGPALGYAPEQRPSQEKVQDACRLRRLKEIDQADEVVPAQHLGRRDCVKGFRPRPNGNPAEGLADKAGGLQSPVQREAQTERREQHRRRLSRAHRRSSKNVVASRRDDPVRSQIARKVDHNKFRRRGTNEDRSVSGSARRHPLAPLSTGNLTGVRHREFTSRSRLRLVQDMRMKRAPNEKECRAVMLSRRRPTTSASSSNQAARLPQPITARDAGNRKVGIKGNPKKRHRHGRTNLA